MSEGTTNPGPRVGPLRALASRNFRLYFLGQGTSLVGTWMQQLAMSWLVFELTRSPLWLGVVGFAGQIPGFFCAPFAGVFVERWNRHRLLLVTQTLAMLQAFLLAVLVFAGVIHVWQILVLSFVLGVVNAFDMTARQAFLTEIVGRREDLANGIALNSAIVNGARLIGPSLAGLLLAETSAGVCFLVNGLSYLAVLAALLAMRLPPAIPHRLQTRFVEQLREGVVYAFGFPPIRAILILLGLASLLGMSYSVLLPVYATDTLHGGARTLGFLMAASGVGALAGALKLTLRRTVLGLGKWVVFGPAGYGAALAGLAFCENTLLAMLLLALAGFVLMVQLASSNTLLQTIVEEDKRSRIMSLYTTAFLGMAPLGSLLTGGLAQYLGVTGTFLIVGLACAAAAALFGPRLPRIREQVRPIYIRLGILPEISAGLQAASEMTLPPAEQ